jgi:hypothetical protein
LQLSDRILIGTRNTFTKQTELSPDRFKDFWR